MIIIHSGRYERGAQLHYECIRDDTVTIAHAQGRREKMEDVHVVQSINIQLE